jgi:hypothetical protein
LNALDICLWGWMKGEVNKMQVDTADEFPAHILDAAGCINQLADQQTNST